MPFYEKGKTRIYYEEAGSGFPLLVIAGGGLNSKIAYFTGNAPFNPVEEFKGEYRVITMDLRNANGGQSSGPLEVDRPKWAPKLLESRPDLTMATVDAFLKKMYCDKPDFVFTVTRDFVRNCQTPILVLPDDVESHPYAVAMETVQLSPNAEVSLYPWKEAKETIAQAVAHVRKFLKSHAPVPATH